MSLRIDHLPKVSYESQKTKASVETSIRRIKSSDFNRKVMRIPILWTIIVCIIHKFFFKHLKLLNEFKFFLKMASGI